MMMNWLAENMATLIISAILFLILAAIVVSRVKNRKNGKSGCGCGCDNCAMKNECHKS